MIPTDGNNAAAPNIPSAASTETARAVLNRLLIICLPFGLVRNLGPVVTRASSRFRPRAGDVRVTQGAALYAFSPALVCVFDGFEAKLRKTTRLAMMTRKAMLVLTVPSPSPPFARAWDNR